MHRNRVWISRLPRILILGIFALLICAQAAWGQEYGTNVNGGVATCGGSPKYNQNGVLSSSGKEDSVCAPAGILVAGASASSTASLQNGTHGVVAVGGPASAYAGFITYDTLTLIPPPGFDGSSVDFTISDSYSVTTILNMGGSGKVKICWQYGPAGTKDQTCATTVTGKGGSFTRSMTLTSKSQFAVQIAKVGSADAKSSTGTGWSAEYTTPAHPTIGGLPKGWLWVWSSGTE